MELKKMNIEDFKNQMYDEYTKLFPEDEQRDWEDIEKSYYDGVEILYGKKIKTLLFPLFMGFF